MGNRIVHAEVVGKDGPALQDFYGKLFDWKQNTDLPGGYAMTDHEDSGIVLGTGPAPDGGAGWVTFYVSVADLDATLAKAVDLGGQRRRAEVQPGARDLARDGRGPRGPRHRPQPGCGLARAARRRCSSPLLPTPFAWPTPGGFPPLHPARDPCDHGPLFA